MEARTDEAALEKLESLDEVDPAEEVAMLAAQLRGHLGRLAAHRVRHVPLTATADIAPLPAPGPGSGAGHVAVAVAVAVNDHDHVNVNVAVDVNEQVNGNEQVNVNEPNVEVGMVFEKGAGSTALAVVREDLGDCQRCKLCSTRKNIVFGVGSPDADLVFVGEGPGANEDLQGEPFVGDAGQLLTKMIEAMGWRRQDVYICNIVKCRPPGNRNPEADEIAACEPFLKAQLAALKPRIIVALGKFAAQWLTGKTDAPISSLRGKFHSYEGIQVMPTYHPAYLLRTPGQKRTVWGDLQLVMQELERLGIRRSSQPGGAPAG